jgi:hypothetical protein
MWFTISPWRLRDLLNWATAMKRVKIGSTSGWRCAFVVVLGLTAFARCEMGQPRQEKARISGG